jgi:histidine triad (HIT) family protein
MQRAVLLLGGVLAILLNMQESIFTKIIKGDIPAYKIYEDQTTFAFLDIHPAVEGHILVVPKRQVDRLENLASEEYQALLQAVKRVMQRLVTVYGQEYRACIKVEGFDVPHAHIHVLPCRDAADFWKKQNMAIEPDHQQLAKVAEKLTF